MEDFIFKGEWEFKLQLTKLGSLNKDIHAFRTKKTDGQYLIPVRINDVEDLKPDPTPEQIEAIHYLQNNQGPIYSTLFKIFKNVLYPRFKENDLEIENKCWYPDLNEEADLYNVISLSEIIIESEFKDGIAYIKFQGEFSGDMEHGYAIIIHKNRLIDFGGNSDLWIENILKDKGIEVVNILEDYVNRDKPTSSELYMPHEKFNRSKPWQIRHNDSLILNWIREMKNDKIIQMINSSLLSEKITTYNFDKIIRVADIKGNRDLVRLLKKS